MGALLDAGTLQIFDFMARSSLTTLDALERCVRYQGLLHEACALRIEVASHEVVLELGIRDGLPFPRQVSEFFMASLFQALYRLQVPPEGRARFAHSAPLDATPYAAFFKVPVEFGTARHEAVFPLDALLLPLPSPDAALASALEKHAAEMLARIPRAGQVSERVRAQLLHHLPSGEPSLVILAKQLNMSERTLRRRLAAESQTYKALLDELRHGLALSYMQSSEVDAERLAFLLGFAEASSLRRAFKRWTGSSISEYRSQHKATKHPPL
jgi:AraC-like DNA-binding protein